MLTQAEGVTIDATDEKSDPVQVTDPTEDFAGWVTPHLAVLGALARREVPAAEAPDLLQDTLERAWRKRGHFRSERGSPRSWLVAILLDQARRRRTRRRPEVVTAEPLVAPTTDRHPDHDLDRAVARLPRRQRQVITLFYLADLSVTEVAGILGVSAGTVKSALSDARAGLRRLLEEPDEN